MRVFPPPGTHADPASLILEVVSLAKSLPTADLPDLVGELARAQAIAISRLASAVVPARNGDEVASLLTAEDVAGILRISEANVYARAKTDLRSAAVEIGAGQLRFERSRIGRFIDARRRA